MAARALDVDGEGPAKQLAPGDVLRLVGRLDRVAGPGGGFGGCRRGRRSHRRPVLRRLRGHGCGVRARHLEDVDCRALRALRRLLRDRRRHTSPIWFPRRHGRRPSASTPLSRPSRICWRRSSLASSRDSSVRRLRSLPPRVKPLRVWRSSWGSSRGSRRRRRMVRHLSPVNHRDERDAAQVLALQAGR